MKKLFFSLGLTALAVSIGVAASNDPVIMKVNGRPVYKSEFEYLYHKNSDQQVEHQTLSQYVDMFVNYKLKVADALANKLDTTASYKTELNQYRAELSAPYMRDTVLEKQLLDEAYQHYIKQRKVAHIMLNLAQTPDEIAKIEERADSIRNEILAGRLSWDDAVQQFTIDQGTKQRGGEMGWMTAERLPMPFVDMAYATPVGEISTPVNSGFGFHLIRVEDERPNPGEVHGRHILKLTRNVSSEQAEQAKVAIDSIYNVLVGGADFAYVATRESQDPGSARRGGDLDWYGAGMMVQPFDSLSFALEDGVISKPFQTAFGWHILQIIEHRPAKSRQEMTATLQAIVNGSDKANLSQTKYREGLVDKYNGHLIDKNLDAIEKQIAANPGGYDSTMVAKLSTMTLPVAQVAKTKITLAQVMPDVSITSSTDAKNARMLITTAAQKHIGNVAMDIERDAMLVTNADYRNLINEYSDGILLFDISQQRVWQRAANDREGMEKYFAEHKDKYTFDEPRFKGYIIFTANDSLENAIKDYLKTVTTVNHKTFNKELRDKFGKDVRAERVIAKKGENPITDYLAFDGPRPDDSKLSWSNFFTFRGKIVDNPEEVDDIRGQVATDYQNALEEEWLKELRAKYPVKIDKKVLGTVKEL